MLQLLRNYALERNFVVADVDLSPERRLWGSNGEGLATYREAMHNLSTKTRPDGGALAALLERWISDVLALVQRESSLDPASPELSLIHISEPTRLGMISYAVFCLKKKNK